MKLLDEYEMSHFAYLECWNGNDIPEMRKLITHQRWALLYCLNIKDRPEMRNNIKDIKLYHFI